MNLTALHGRYGRCRNIAVLLLHRQSLGSMRLEEGMFQATRLKGVLTDEMDVPCQVHEINELPQQALRLTFRHANLITISYPTLHYGNKDLKETNMDISWFRMFYFHTK